MSNLCKYLGCFLLFYAIVSWHASVKTVNKSLAIVEDSFKEEAVKNNRPVVFSGSEKRMLLKINNLAGRNMGLNKLIFQIAMALALLAIYYYLKKYQERRGTDCRTMKKGGVPEIPCDDEKTGSA